MALEQFKTQVLLLHSEQSTLDALGAGFGDRYSVHYATTGSEALNTLGEVPIHVIVSAQNLPGMSGLEALREARKRSPDTIGILLAGSDRADGLEALVGDKEVFQIVRGSVTPDALIKLIETATRRVRLMTLAESANDTAADVDEPSIESGGEHIVMETAENGSSIISDGTGRMPALKPERIQSSPHAGGHEVDVLVLTKDQEFLKTIKDSSRGMHEVHHATTANQAQEVLRSHKVGVLVTDAAVAGAKIQVLTQALRADAPRLVAVVAGRRDDGEQLMELINKGQVYRFLMKPVSPGRARLAIEASVKYHLDAPDSVFRGQAAAPAVEAAPAQRPAPAAPAQRPPATPPKPAPRPESRPAPAARQAPPAPEPHESLADSGRRIAPVIGPAPAAGNAAPAEDIPNPMTLDGADNGGILSGRMPLFAGAGVVAVIAIIGIWSLFGGSTEVPTDAAAPADLSTNISPVNSSVEDTAADIEGDGESLRRPAVTESDVPAVLREPAATPAAAAPAPAWAGMLEDARLARDAGRIIAPPGNNAIELYIAAQDAFPDNETIAAELALLVDQVYGMAESALLDNRTADAAAALEMVALTDAGSPRLAFLNAQLAQIQLRSALDGARNAIREGRFEDAGRLLNRAQGIAGTNSAKVNQIAEDLAQARSAQQVDEVLALAGERLAAEQLTAPVNDNARYYFELALNNDPGNSAAQQGLNAVASKLVLRARTAIDAGSLDDAETLLDDARALDPASADLEASVAALEAARERIAAEERQAAAERAEAARQAAAQEEAARQAEAERLADLQRQEAEAATAPAAGNALAETTDASDAGEAGTVQSPLDSSTATSAGRAAGGPGSLPFDGLVNELAGSPVAGGSAEPEGTTTTDNDGRPASGAPAATAPGGEDEIVAISRLTRVNYVAPTYPRSAARRNISGWVDIAFTVSPQGAVTNIDIMESAPGSIFDDAAKEAVAEWRFDPVIENGVAVPKRVAVRMSFNLE